MIRWWILTIILSICDTLAYNNDNNNVLQPPPSSSSSSFSSYMEVGVEPDTLVFGAALASNGNNNGTNSSMMMTNTTHATTTTSTIRYDVRCKNDCSERGWCNPTNGVCVCDIGYRGDDCTKRYCVNECSGNGKCVNDTCQCQSTWYGIDCSVRGAPLIHCHGHGYEKDGQCVCHVGWLGSTCEQESGCPNGCSGHGTCSGGVCYCAHGYTGVGCEQKECPDACSGHGKCDSKSGRCTCEPSYFGDTCNKRRCLDDCMGHGICNATSGMCQCYPGYYGANCDPRSCMNDCSKRGTCVFDKATQRGKCLCQPRWSGDGCHEPTCPRNCSNNGNCTESGCLCLPSYTGRDCSVRTCPLNCSGETHGFCNNATFECTCLNGWGGDACNERLCPDNCNWRGACKNGTCACNDWWTGRKCEVPKCRQNDRGFDCDGHGQCIKPVIANSPADAMNAALNQSIDRAAQAIASTRSRAGGQVPHTGGSGGGGAKADQAYCKCAQGWGGDDCSVKLCKNDCSGHGICSFGQCFCKRGFFGEDCSLEAKVEKKRIEHEAQVLNAPLTQCQQRCVNGKCMYVPKPVQWQDMKRPQKFVVHHTYDCFCTGDWGGENCTVPLHACPKGCYDEKTGKCIKGCLGDGACHAVDGLSCAGHGECKQGVCHCKFPWAGPACDVASCPKNCNGQGYCNTSRRKCLCNAGWAGDACDVKLRTEGI